MIESFHKNLGGPIDAGLYMLTKKEEKEMEEKSIMELLLETRDPNAGPPPHDPSYYQRDSEQDLNDFFGIDDENDEDGIYL